MLVKCLQVSGGGSQSIGSVRRCQDGGGGGSGLAKTGGLPGCSRLGEQVPYAALTGLDSEAEAGPAS